MLLGYNTLMSKAMLIIMIQAIATQHGLDPSMMVAIAKQESSLRPAVVSSSGDVGLMQLSPRTARAYGCDLAKLVEPAYNVRCAARYLADLKKTYSKREPTTWMTRYHHGRDKVLRFKYQIALERFY